MNSPNEALPPERDDGAGGGSTAPKKLGDLHKAITMAEIAKQAGVSQGAISSLLNDRDYGIRVSEKTRERVFKVCRDLGYIPNDLRAVVRMYPEFGDFCLLLSDQIPGGLAHPFCARLAAGCQAAMQEPSRPLTLATYEDARDYAGDPTILPQPVSSGVVSKFLCHGSANSSLLHTLAKRGFPMVSLGYDAPLPGVVSIVPDYMQAARLAIEHFVELGHRQIAIISGAFGTSDWPILELNHGVRLACDALRIPLEPHNIIYSEAAGDLGAALTELLARKPEPTAIFCMTDATAAAAVAIAAERKSPAPQKLSVIGCGDDPCARLVHPRLTTIRLPVEELAAAGIAEIDRMVREPIPSEPRKVLLPVSLVKRDSCAVARK